MSAFAENISPYPYKQAYANPRILHHDIAFLFLWLAYY
jgi:hypothetical protein